MKQKASLIMFIALLWAVYAKAQTSVFDTLQQLPATERIKNAEAIYNKKIRQADSTLGFKELGGLTHLAEKLDDRELECYSWSLMADHHARKTGFSILAESMHLKAIDLAKRYHLDVQTGVACYKLGRFYYNFKKYLAAFEYLIKADGILKQAGYDQLPDAAAYLHYMGTVYYSIEDFDKAAYYFKQALVQQNSDHWLRMQTPNTLAVIQQNKGDYKAALGNFMLTLKEASAHHDSIWGGIVSGNIGSLMYQMGQFDKAMPYLRSSFQLNMHYREFGNALFAKIYQIKTDLAQNRIADAKTDIAEGSPVLAKDNSLKHRQQWYEVLAQFAEKTNNAQVALKYWEKQRILTDSITKQKDFTTYYNMQLRLETEKHLAMVSVLEADIRDEQLKRNSFILILFLLMVVALLSYNRIRLKRRSERVMFEQKEALLRSEKLRTEGELQNAGNLLNNYTENIRQKNELIEQFTAELEKLKENLPANSLNNAKVEDFEKLLRSIILTDDDWDAFRKLFERVHTGFFFRLKEIFPNLSVGDTRLISLIKLQLSNREMANMMGVSVDAVKKAKQRLRKKDLLPDDDQSLEDFIVGI